MTTDHDLAAGVRAALVGAGAVSEIKMFGGIGFMLNGNMVATASKRGLMLRVGKGCKDEALAQLSARPVQMRGRTMEGYAFIDPAGLNDERVRAGVELALAHVRTLPPKAAGDKQAPAKDKQR